MGFVAQRVAGGRFGKLRNDADVAGMDGADGDGLLAARNIKAAEAFLNFLNGVPQACIGAERSGENTEIGLLAYVGVGSGFPDIQGDGAAVVGFENFIAGFALGGNRFGLQRGGHELHDGIQEGRDADLGIAGGNQDGDEGTGLNHSSQTAGDFIAGQFAAFQVLFQQGVVAFGGSFHHRGAGIFGFGFQIRRDFLAGFRADFERFHGEQVDDAFEILFLADGQLDG